MPPPRAAHLPFWAAHCRPLLLPLVVLPLLAGLLAVGVVGAGVAAVGMSRVMRVQRLPPLLGMLASRVRVMPGQLPPLPLLHAAPPLLAVQLSLAELSLALLLQLPPVVAERLQALLTLPQMPLSPPPLPPRLCATRCRLTSSSWRTACLKAGGKWRWRAGVQRAVLGAAASTTLGLPLQQQQLLLVLLVLLQQLQVGLLHSRLSTWSEQMPTLASCSACHTPASSTKADGCRVQGGMAQGGRRGGISAHRRVQAQQRRWKQANIDLASDGSGHHPGAACEDALIMCKPC